MPQGVAEVIGVGPRSFGCQWQVRQACAVVRDQPYVRTGISGTRGRIHFAAPPQYPDCVDIGLCGVGLRRELCRRASACLLYTSDAADE